MVKEKKVLKNPVRTKTIKERKVKVSHKFILALAIVSILGFLGIASETILNKNISEYIESLWMLIIGIAFIIEARIKTLKSLSKMDNLISSAAIMPALKCNAMIAFISLFFNERTYT